VRVAPAAILCLLALLATACGQRAEPTGATVEVFPITVTDAEGETTDLEQEPRRIRAADDSMAATLRALGVSPRRIVVGTGEAGADVDLTAAWSTNRGAGPRQPGAPIYIAADQSIDDVKSSLLDLGLLVGRPLRARELVNRINRPIGAVRDRLNEQPPVTVFLDAGTFNTISSPGLVDDIIRSAGGRNVAGAATENQRPSPAELRRLQPRYYLATTSSGTTLQRLRQDREMARLDAVRAERFGIVPDTVLEPGPSVGRGVLTIARILHPDEFR
jgi:ABC-type Fe3+-hydroxamate transport system substrate-binding protein